MSSTTQAEKAHQQVAVLYNGEIREFAYHPQEHAEVLLQQARHAFGITTNPHLMGLFDLAGRELSDSESLSENHVTAGEELLLRQSVVRGG
jgi:hypothetical protein